MIHAPTVQLFGTLEHGTRGLIFMVFRDDQPVDFN